MAWKRNEPEPPTPTPPPASTRQPQRSTGTATIGSSIRIKGDLSGDEDLLVQGQIQGKIKLDSHNVTVGSSGRVQADIRGRNIRVEGEVHGNLFGEEEIVIRASGRVEGNLQAPRVTLENGAKFKGSIDMDAGAGRRRQAAGAPAAKPTAPAEAPSDARPGAVGAQLAADPSKG